MPIPLGATYPNLARLLSEHPEYFHDSKALRAPELYAQTIKEVPK